MKINMKTYAKESMDIYSKFGTEVVYTGEGGTESDLEYANNYLEIGKTYTVRKTNVHNWHTDVYLQEIKNEDGRCIFFNSVHFIPK